MRLVKIHPGGAEDHYINPDQITSVYTDGSRSQNGSFIVLADGREMLVNHSLPELLGLLEPLEIKRPQ